MIWAPRAHDIGSSEIVSLEGSGENLTVRYSRHWMQLAGSSIIAGRRVLVERVLLDGIFDIRIQGYTF